MSNMSKIPVKTTLIKKNKKRPLTIKQRKFIARTIETGNATQAAVEIYNGKDIKTARGIASENLQKPAIKEAIDKALEARGVNPEYIISRLQKNIEAGIGVEAKATDANKALSILANMMMNSSKQEENVTYNFNFQGKTREELESERNKLRSITDAILVED